MADDSRDIKSEAVDAALEDMRLEDGGELEGTQEGSPQHGNDEEAATPDGVKRSRSGTPARKSSSKSPPKDSNGSQTPKSEYDEEEIIGGDITMTEVPGKVPKLSRKATQKVVARPPELFNDLPDSTEESLSVFQIIPECLYGSKSMGKSKMSDDDDGPIDCDCSEERSDGVNLACGEDSDCINRATKLECINGDCPCGRDCQNQRFQRKQYANVSVIKTDKKGFGLRANVDLNVGDFVFEYIGEVINEPTFRRRTIQYDQEGIKHFYFMSLNKSEFIDATKKGNLGRFCNHSCNPNCYVDKWVIGSKLRMGIFAERNIQAGEELVFNYNVDRYGADPQPCYCGEHNCSGYIGGKTQSGRATKLSHGTIEALGIDDGDGWDTATAKKPRKKKAGEDDEEYVNNVQPKGLDEEGVRKVMAALMQCKEKWIAVKLLDRIQRCDDDRVRNRVIQMHGYQILRSTLSTWKEDDNIVLQVLDILYKFPRLTRNKISDSKIEASVQALVDREHEDVAFEAKRLVEAWSKLEVAYRIPRKKFDPNAAPVYDRRNVDRVEEVVKPAPVVTAVAPTGPRGGFPQRGGHFMSQRPPMRRPAFSNVLPSGWFTATDEKGNTYYYSKAGSTTWQRPTLPAAEPPPPPKAPPKSVQTAKALQDIIDSITKAEPTSQSSIVSTPPSKSTPKEKKKPVEKWRSLPIEKQMKLYENTMLSHTKETMQRFSKKLPKEDLKKFGKEVNKKLVASDYKNKRVEDPTKMSKSQAEKAKHYVKQFFEKAVEKKKAIDRHKKEKEARRAALNGSSHTDTNGKAVEVVMDTKEDGGDEPDADVSLETDLIELSPSTPVPETPNASESSDLKRKRNEGEETPGDESDTKRLKEELSPPPPPPPPPADTPEAEVDIDDEDQAEELVQDVGDVAVVVVRETKEERERREQEEELMRENEEAMMMDMDGSLQSADAVKHLHFNGHVNGSGSGDYSFDSHQADSSIKANPGLEIRAE